MFRKESRAGQDRRMPDATTALPEAVITAMMEMEKLVNGRRIVFPARQDNDCYMSYELGRCSSGFATSESRGG